MAQYWLPSAERTKFIFVSMLVGEDLDGKGMDDQQ